MTEPATQARALYNIYQPVNQKNGHMSKKIDIKESDLWGLSLFAEGYNREYYTVS